MSFTATNKRSREEFQYGQFTSFSSFSGRKEKRQQFLPGKNNIDETTAKVLRLFHSSSSAPSASFHVEVEADSDTPKVTKSVGGHWRPKRTFKGVVSNPNILKVTCSSYSSLLNNIHSYKLSGLVVEAASVLEKRTQEYEEQFKEHKLEVEEFSVLEAYVGLAWDEFSDQISQKKHLEIEAPRLLASKNASYVKLNSEKEKIERLEKDLTVTENLMTKCLARKRAHLTDFEAMREQLTVIFEGQEEQVDEIRLCLTPRERRRVEEPPTEPPTKNTALLSRIQAYESERSELFVTDTESDTENVSFTGIFQLKTNSLQSDLQSIRLFEVENSQKIKLAQIKKEQTIWKALVKEKQGHEKLLKMYSAEREADTPMSKLSDEEKSFQKFVSLKKDIRHLRYGLAFMRFFKHAAQDSKRTFIGPLGTYLQLKSGASEQQKHMVSWFLSKLLKTFIVFSLSDKLYFERKNKEYGSEVDVVLHKVTPREAPDVRNSPTDTIKSFLDISDPVVLDYLESVHHIHLIGVSDLRYEPSSQLFFNSMNQPQHADHIKGRTLICSEDMRVAEVTTVISELEFEQKAEYPDLTLYHYLEATVNTAHVLQEWKEHVLLLGQLVEGQLRVCKELGPEHLARRELCEATQRRKRLRSDIQKLSELQKQCLSLRERLLEGESELRGHGAAQKELLEKGKVLSQSLQAAEVSFNEADKKYQAASQELTTLRNNSQLSKAIEDNAERRKVIQEYSLKYPGSNLRRKAKSNTLRSIETEKIKLNTREDELEKEKEYLEERTRFSGLEEYYEEKIIWGYLSKLGVDVDPNKRFDKVLAKKATVAALSQLDCPTVFVNGDIDVPGKQVMVVKRK